MAGRGSAGSEARRCACDTFRVVVNSWEGINPVSGDRALTCTEGSVEGWWWGSTTCNMLGAHVLLHLMAKTKKMD